MRLTLKNEETDVVINIGVAGSQANAGGRTGSYELMPGDSCPVEIDEATTISFTSRKVEPTPAAE